MSSTEKKRPNIVFILSDDLGWGDVSLHGSAQVKTPNIDLLATNGIILNNYYVSPLCTPSRGALMTGYHPIHLGLQHNVIYSTQPWGLHPSYTILPQYLHRLGYSNHMVGKWHLGFFKKEYLPTRRGFDSHFGFLTGHIDYFDKTSGRDPRGYDFNENEKSLNLSEYEGQYVTDMITDRAVDIISRSPQNPLFLLVSHLAVHTSNKENDPVQAPTQYINRFNQIENLKRKKFCAMVSSLDESVGQIFSALKNANKLNDTILIFSTDNGGATGGTGKRGVDNSIGSNWPLRGSKYTLFEGGIRGFAFIWSPILNKKYLSNHLMHIQDWLPTIYSAVGGRYQDLGPIDGIDMWDTLNNDLDNPRKQLLHNIDDIWNMWALRDGDYKLISGTFKGFKFNSWFLPPGELNSTDNQIDYENCKVFNVMKEMNYKITNVKQIETKCGNNTKNICKLRDNPCLFNIRSDPCEYYNLYEEKPQIVKQMLNLLSKYNSTAVKPLNQGRDEKSDPKYHNNFWSVWK